MQSLYEFSGKVIKGAKRGKRLGFPTANIVLNQQIPEGVYVSTVEIFGKIYQAATFIGSAKTFGEKDYKAEAYILNFNQDIYGKQLKIKLFKKLRENKKFDSEEALTEQMKEDVLRTSEFFRESL